MIIEKLTQQLRTRAAHLGYNKKELRGIAEAISNNSELTDDATEEAINAEIEAVLPFLKIGQQQASRIASAMKTEPNQGGDEDDPAASALHKNPNPPKQDPTDEPAWAKALREQNEAIMARLAATEGERTAATRAERIGKVVEGCGSFAEATLRGLSRMQFKTDEDFEEYVAEVTTSAEAVRKELGGSALSTLTGKPGGAGASKPTEAPSDDDLGATFGV